MANPIIPWIGGKRRLVDLLLGRFPPHECYCVVFAGGAAVFFARNPAPVEVLNDVNGDLARCAESQLPLNCRNGRRRIHYPCGVGVCNGFSFGANALRVGQIGDLRWAISVRKTFFSSRP